LPLMLNCANPVIEKMISSRNKNALLISLFFMTGSYYQVITGNKCIVYHLVKIVYSRSGGLFDNIPWGN